MTLSSWSCRLFVAFLVLEVAVLFFCLWLSRFCLSVWVRSQWEELPSVCFLWGRPVCPLCLCRRQLAAVYFNQHSVCQRAAAFSLLEMAVLVFSSVVQVGHDSRSRPWLFPVGWSTFVLDVGTNLNIQRFLKRKKFFHPQANLFKPHWWNLAWDTQVRAYGYIL